MCGYRRLITASKLLKETNCFGVATLVVEIAVHGRQVPPTQVTPEIPNSHPRGGDRGGLTSSVWAITSRLRMNVSPSRTDEKERFRNAASLTRIFHRRGARVGCDAVRWQGKTTQSTEGTQVRTARAREKSQARNNEPVSVLGANHPLQMCRNALRHPELHQ